MSRQSFLRKSGMYGMVGRGIPISEVVKPVNKTYDSMDEYLGYKSDDVKIKADKRGEVSAVMGTGNGLDSIKRKLEKLRIKQKRFDGNITFNL